jgi:hypothetical protein
LAGCRPGTSASNGFAGGGVRGSYASMRSGRRRGGARADGGVTRRWLGRGRAYSGGGSTGGSREGRRRENGAVACNCRIYARGGRWRGGGRGIATKWAVGGISKSDCGGLQRRHRSSKGAMIRKALDWFGKGLEAVECSTKYELTGFEDPAHWRVVHPSRRRKS